MKIKSELKETIVSLKPGVSVILISLLIATVLAFFIIGFGEGIIVKLIFFAGVVVLSLILLADESLPNEKKIKIAIRDGSTVLITLILLEIMLFFHATSYSKVINIKLIPNTKVESVDTGTKDINNNILYKNVTRNIIEFYDKETNEKIDYKAVDGLSDEVLKLYTTIKAKEYYIEYFPFFTYSKKFRYIRE